jgi:hypothetical protein
MTEESQVEFNEEIDRSVRQAIENGNIPTVVGQESAKVEMYYEDEDEE